MTRSWAALLALTFLALSTNLVRFRDPGHERYVTVLPPGGSDFIPAFQGARALRHGLDPYWIAAPELRDPWRRDLERQGRWLAQVHPPAYLVALLPLAAAAGEDPRAGSRLWFWLALGTLGALAWVCTRLLARLDPTLGEERDLLLALFFFLLALPPSAQQLLERGQADALGALLLWSGVLARLHARPRSAGALLGAALAIKLHPALAALALLAAPWEGRGRAAAAALAMATLLTLPAAPWVAEWATWGLWRTLAAAVQAPPPGGWPEQNLFELASRVFGPAGRAPGGLLLGLALLASVVPCWRGRLGEGRALVRLATAAVAAGVGLSPLSDAPETLVVLPGVLVLAFAARHAPAAAAWWTAATLLVAASTPSGGVPLAMLGLLLVPPAALLDLRGERLRPAASTP